MKKKDFKKMLQDKQFAIIEDVNDNTLEKSMIKLEREKLELENKKLEHEMKTKDRVDISLKEYLAMREEIEQLKQDNATHKKALQRIGVNDYDFKNVERTFIDDPAKCEYHINIRLSYDKMIKKYKPPIGWFILDP